MNPKKNFLSYVIWLVFAIYILVMIAGCTFSFVDTLKIEQYVSQTYQKVLLFLGVVIAFALIFILVRGLALFVHNHMRNKETLVDIFSIVWPILIILGSVGIICYYLLHNMPITLDNELYYRQAVVTGQSKSFVIHGMSSLYICVLHVLFLLFGNNPFAGIVLQLVLYFALLTLIYFVSIRLCGIFPACAALTFAGILYIPTFLNEIFSLTPELLYLCMYFLGLLWISGIIKRLCNASSWGLKQGIGVYLVGIYVGYLIYLDLFSITLLFFMVGIFYMEKVSTKTAFFVNAIALIGILNGFVFVFLSLYLLKGIEPMTYLTSLGGLYFESFQMMMPSIMPLQKGYSALVMLFMLFGIVPGYTIWKKDCITTWIAGFMVLLIMQFFTINRLEYNIVVTVFVSIMAGIGLYCYVVSNETASFRDMLSTNQEDIVEDKNIQANEASEVTETIVSTEDDMELLDFTKPVETDEPKAVTQEQQPPLPGQPLHNPLPVPKKHVKKSYDFPYEIADSKLEFDHKVDENDDFDLA